LECPWPPPPPLYRRPQPRLAEPFPKPTRGGFGVPTRIPPILSKPRGESEFE
jgi:hypothetical protein